MNLERSDAPAATQTQPNEPLLYFGGGAGTYRFSAWRAAPRRCAVLAGAWALLLPALFLPGCDVSASGNRTGVRPTYVVYSLTAQYTLLLGGHLFDMSRGAGSLDLKDDGLPLAIACPLFLLGSAAFLLTPPLLRRRLRNGLRWVDWVAVALLPAPWALLAASAYNDSFDHFLYGFYLLAAVHTAACAALVWPTGKPAPADT